MTCMAPMSAYERLNKFYVTKPFKTLRRVALIPAMVGGTLPTLLECIDENLQGSGYKRLQLHEHT